MNRSISPVNIICDILLELSYLELLSLPNQLALYIMKHLVSYLGLEDRLSSSVGLAFLRPTSQQSEVSIDLWCWRCIRTPPFKVFPCVLHLLTFPSFCFQVLCFCKQVSVLSSYFDNLVLLHF